MPPRVPAGTEHGHAAGRSPALLLGGSGVVPRSPSQHRCCSRLLRVGRAPERAASPSGCIFKQTQINVKPSAQGRVGGSPSPPTGRVLAERGEEPGPVRGGSPVTCGAVTARPCGPHAPRQSCVSGLGSPCAKHGGGGCQMLGRGEDPMGLRLPPSSPSGCRQRTGGDGVNDRCTTAGDCGTQPCSRGGWGAQERAPTSPCPGTGWLCRGSGESRGSALGGATPQAPL